jgi:hypothetical protein
METERKSITLHDLKLSDTGEFSALFAPFNKIDLQGDLTLPGAFGKQNVVISAYGHGSSMGMALPVGKGSISDGETGGIVKGKFFLDTQGGKDTYTVVKELGDLQEWSYSLPEIDYEMRTIDDRSVRVLKRIKVKEVSPVMMGAGIDTHTLDVKSAVGVHHTKTDTGAWDAGAAKKNLKMDASASYYKSAHAWFESGADLTLKGSYKFIHHFVSSDGDVGAASTRACSNGIGILNGGRGGADIPDADRKGVHAHLAAHLKDAGAEPPELRSEDAEVKSLPLADHLEIFVVDGEGLIERIKGLAELRDAQGRLVSQPTMKRVQIAMGTLENLLREFREVAAKHDRVQREYLRFQKTLSNME